MSVYSGFANRQLESSYNKLITTLLKILQRRIVKFYRNEQADEKQFKRVVEDTLTKLNQMEHKKYNEPYISVVMGEICELLQIQQNCSAGCVCQCHLQQRKQTFLTQDKEITSNPSSCRRQTGSSRKASMKGMNNTTALIEKPLVPNVHQIAQQLQTYRQPYYLSNNHMQPKINYNSNSNHTHNGSFDRPNSRGFQNTISKSPIRGEYSRVLRSSEGGRANPNESFEERRCDKIQQPYGAVYRRIFSKRCS